MYQQSYNSFVRASTSQETSAIKAKPLSGKEAKRLYLEEISREKLIISLNKPESSEKTDFEVKVNDYDIADKDAFTAAQNDDVQTLRAFLDCRPESINMTDNFGWSLLMIACQANSAETVKELLNRKADTSIRDKAGNSAQSLVIKNKNLTLIDIFLSNKEQNNRHTSERQQSTRRKRKTHPFTCEVCDNKVFPNRIEHLHSTLHNMNASKNIKAKSCYKIPLSNRGYQIMLKGGWDRDSGLGPDGSGKMYPLRAIQKMDRKGLGHEKPKTKEIIEDKIINKTRKMFEQECHRSRNMEINFRREFY